MGNRKTPTRAANPRKSTSASKPTRHDVNDRKYEAARQISENPIRGSGKTEPIQPSPRLVASRMNAPKGGRTTAERYGPEFCQQRAEKGGRATLAMYGREFYRHIARIKHARRASSSPRP